MPDMDGFEFARRVRERSELRNTSLVMISSAHRADDARRCRELGIMRYLTKPIVQSELLNAVLAISRHTKEEKRPADEDAARAWRNGRHLKVLLAEDGLINQKVAVDLLRLHGHEVIVANNGREAVAALERDSFDVVLMDVQMPVMDGLEATAAIRERERKGRERTPIIAMTAAAMKGDREKCLAAGMDNYIAKPIDASDLLQALGDLDGAGRATADADEPPAISESLVHQDILDLETARQRVPGGDSALRELAQMMQDEAPRMIAQIRDAIAARDAARVRHSADRLRGSAEWFAAHRVIESATQLENLGQEGAFEAADRVFAELQRHVAELHAALVQITVE
jgi:CheY-like chemotaxis protein